MKNALLVTTDIYVNEKINTLQLCNNIHLKFRKRIQTTDDRTTVSKTTMSLVTM